MHAEFKGNESLVPIEINPLRFGGFGLAELTYFSRGLNSYETFFMNKKTNLIKSWESSEYYYAWILGYVSNKKDKNQMPDHAKFKSYLGDVIRYIPINHEKNPVFAIAYTKIKTKGQINKYVNTEFADFFT